VVVVVVSAWWVVKVMSQVSAVTVVAAAAVQANAWSPALKWLSILSTSLWARSHATHWLPALWQVALQTVDMINSCPVSQHVQTTYRCRCLLRLFMHTCTSWLSAHILEARMNRTSVIRRYGSPAPSGDGAVTDAGGSGVRM
jgi:hypothetical protein